MVSRQFKKIRRLLRMARILNTIKGVKTTPLGFREGLNATMRAPVPDGVTIKEIEIGDTPALWHTTANSDPDKRILYLHGGGYVAGTRTAYSSICGHMALQTGASVLLPEYRLAPENPFPAGHDDCFAAWQHIVGHRPDGSDTAASKLMIMGDSAGGGLTLSTGQAVRDGGGQQPDALILISPWLDATCNGESYRTRRWADVLLTGQGLRACAAGTATEEQRAQPRMSPLFGSFAKLPPMLLETGDAEVLLSDSVRAFEKAKEAGVDVTFNQVPEMIHIWQVIWPGLPESAESIDRMGDFARQHLS